MTQAQLRHTLEDLPARSMHGDAPLLAVHHDVVLRDQIVDAVAYEREIARLEVIRRSGGLRGQEVIARKLVWRRELVMPRGSGLAS